MCVMGLVASQAMAVELAYTVQPGAKLQRETKMEAEFILLGDIPGFDKIDGGQNGSSKIVFELEEISDAAKVKITGTREIALTLNEMPMDPAYMDVGPATLTIGPTGEIMDSTLPDFEATEQNLLTLGWLAYIQGQLDVPTLLPEGGTIAAGKSWTNTVFIKNPAGGQMNGEATSRVMGTSWNDGKCAWIHSSVKIPLKLSFKTESGSYKANGDYNVSSVSCFNIDKGFDTERKAFTTAQFQIVAEGEEQSYNIDIMISGKEVTKVKEVKEEEEKKEASAEADAAEKKPEEKAEKKAEEN
jgi:hypothetical protein